jgi:hypothetical protein
MKPPKKIKVGGHYYTIVLKEEEFASSSHEDTILVGEHVPMNSQIRLCIKGSNQFIARILLHETLHAIFDHQGIDLPVKEEEDLVNRITWGLSTVIADNPVFVKYLQTNLKG